MKLLVCHIMYFFGIWTVYVTSESYLALCCPHLAKKKKGICISELLRSCVGKKKVSHLFVLSQKSVVRSGTLHISNIQKFYVIASVNSVLLLPSLLGKLLFLYASSINHFIFTHPVVLHFIIFVATELFFFCLP